MLFIVMFNYDKPADIEYRQNINFKKSVPFIIYGFTMQSIININLRFKNTRRSLMR